MKPAETKDQVSLLALHTPCQTFLKEISTTISDFEAKGRADENDNKAIAKIKQLLLPKEEKSLPPLNGVTSRRVLKEILREFYSYFGWRYWSTLAQLLDAIRRKPEFSEMALGNGDFQMLLPNYEHMEALKRETREAKQETVVVKKENEQLKEDNRYLSTQAKTADDELVKAWEEKEGVEKKLAKSEEERKSLAQQHVSALRAAHGWKQAYITLKEKVEKEAPSILVPQLPEHLTVDDRGSAAITAPVDLPVRRDSPVSSSYGHSGGYDPKLFGLPGQGSVPQSSSAPVLIVTPGSPLDVQPR